MPKKKQKTVQVDKVKYIVHEAGNLYWKILIKKDENEHFYDAIFRKGWEDGGEVEIFSLMPPAHISDNFLLHIRIYTKSIDNDGVPPVPNPMICTTGMVPYFSIVEPELRRIRIQLLCEFEVEGKQLKITIKREEAFL